MHVDTTPSSSSTYQTPEYSFHITYANNNIYESGTQVGSGNAVWGDETDTWEIELLTDGTVKYYRNGGSPVQTSSGASGDYHLYIAIDSSGGYAEYVAYDDGNTGTYTQMVDDDWDIDNALAQTVDSYGKVTKTGSNGWNSYIFSGSADVATTAGDKIRIDIDNAKADYDNPTDADWQRKALGYTADESTCDSESPCGFKATAEINVSSLGDSTQVVVLQDDTDAPQDSTSTSTVGATTDNLVALYDFSVASGDVPNIAADVGSTVSLGSDADIILSNQNNYDQSGSPSGLNNNMLFDNPASNPDNAKGKFGTGSNKSQWNWIHQDTAQWTIGFWMKVNEFPPSSGEDYILGSSWNADSTNGWGVQLKSDGSTNDEGQLMVMVSNTDSTGLVGLSLIHI